MYYFALCSWGGKGQKGYITHEHWFPTAMIPQYCNQISASVRIKYDLKCKTK